MRRRLSGLRPPGLAHRFRLRFPALASLAFAGPVLGVLLTLPRPASAGLTGTLHVLVAVAAFLAAGVSAISSQRQSGASRRGWRCIAAAMVVAGCMHLGLLSAPDD